MKINVAKAITVASHLIGAAPAIIAALAPVIAQLRKPTVQVHPGLGE